MHYLEAIETNDYKRLPGGIFNRSFVKAYARCVGYDEKEAVEGYTRFMRDVGDDGDEISSTPYHSKVYTDTPATRSPVLTVVLAIVILAILTAVALSVLHWVQRRPAQLQSKTSAIAVAYHKRIPCEPANEIAANSLDSWKADHASFLQ
jgi:cytoskeletal protein RodZ